MASEDIVRQDRPEDDDADQHGVRETQQVELLQLAESKETIVVQFDQCAEPGCVLQVVVIAETIGATTCTPGTAGCGWRDGQVVTYDQSAWKGVPAASSLLSSDFATVYAPSGGVTVGLATGFTMSFDVSSFILVYLPAGGAPGALTSNVFNPSTTSSGSFGGDVLALRLNIDFSAAGFLRGTANVLLGNLTLCNLTTAPDLNGLTINQFIAIANTALGGGATTDSIATLDSIASSINAAFDVGVVSTFAQQNIVNGACH